MLIQVDLGHKIPDTIPLEIEEQELMLNGEVDIGIQRTTINHLTKVDVVD